MTDDNYNTFRRIRYNIFPKKVECAMCYYNLSYWTIEAHKQILTRKSCCLLQLLESRHNTSFTWISVILILITSHSFPHPMRLLTFIYSYIVYFQSLFSCFCWTKFHVHTYLWSLKSHLVKVWKHFLIFFFSFHPVGF